ncbi:hypothetical protein BDQ12DRAFT_601697 [Crucibulum laeve]|uniref:U4/U6 snRNA-associated-splicing factor PRP24 n=1 Tax=Crucibulum laeve TaxID=68775 RepID=A0A5C3M5E7_9AGAR|nr:hypothetical protein BDQ12DRAFT_601697 [Crucibulum laeve]
MDESLNALGNLLGQLADNPYDVSLHAQHIRLAQSLEGMNEEVQSALEMMPEFLAAGDEVWLPLIRRKEALVDADTKESVEELLSLYARAEADYQSIPLLQKHLEYIIERHSEYTGEEAKPRPDTLGDVFSTEWTRQAIDEVVQKGIGHLTKSRLLWDAQRDWEMEMLQEASKKDKHDLVDRVKEMHLNRLRQPHSNSDETFQSYSSFTTNYQAPHAYESLLVAASKIRGQGVKAYDRREQMENALTQSNFDLQTYAQYIASERRMRTLDAFVLVSLYERAIAEAAKRRFAQEPRAEEVLRTFWVGYLDSLRILKVEETTELETYKRAVRSVPGSGEVWARYIRFIERTTETVTTEISGTLILKHIAEIYDKALETSLIQSDVEQIVPLALARAGFERRMVEAGIDDIDERLPTMIALLESGIAMCNELPGGDAKLRLEKYLASIYQRFGLTDNAIGVWQAASKKYKSSYLVWTNYTEALIKNEQYDEARGVFMDIHLKQFDWPEAIWEAWISFEHLHGTLEEVETCLDKVEKAQYQLNLRRVKEAEKAAYQAMQMAAEAQANFPVTDAPIPTVDSSTAEVPMEVDSQPSTVERGTKRSVEEEPTQEAHKKARFEQKPPPLKRDRENCTVFVADLPEGVTDEELINLFKDCGKVREVKITKLPNNVVATVEFFERDSIPAALTKDKKRIRDQEVAVHLAWKSTLYVTNFPEPADDPFMRNLFGEYGTLFDIRWPSKKFKNTRRFCYVQFTSPVAAQKALELHGRELEPGLSLNVYVSNPERKKERTDQDANEKEVYVAGLSKFTAKADLEKLFSTYGKVKEVRMATEDNGHAKGYAFIEYEEEKDAQAALAANNYELKKRRIAVTLADPRVRARHRSEIGLSRVAEIRSRSVRILGLPPATQEGLLQQVLEKITPVKRLEVFLDKQEAVVELESAADAGKLLLRTEPIIFNGNILQLSEEGKDGASARSAAPPPKAGGLFVPRRAAVSRPRAGLGHTRAAVGTTPAAKPSATPQASSSSGKGQDDFRKMLG